MSEDCYDSKMCPLGECEECEISPTGAKWNPEKALHCVGNELYLAGVEIKLLKQYLKWVKEEFIDNCFCCIPEDGMTKKQIEMISIIEEALKDEY